MYRLQAVYSTSYCTTSIHLFNLKLCFVSPGISDLPRCSEQVVFPVAMIGHIDASSTHVLLIVLTGASLLHLSNTNLINARGINASTDTLHGLLLSEDGQEQDKKRDPLEKEEEEGELFKDVDLKTLAAVLLASLNQSQVERKIEAEERDEMDENAKAEKWDVPNKSTHRQGRMMEGVDQDRDGHQESELRVVEQGKEDEKEVKQAMADKVNSHITSHTIQADNQPSSLEEGETNKRHVLSVPKHDSNEEEKQIGPNELKSLETVMKEFPQVNIASKRDRDLEQNKRESRSYDFSSNDIVHLDKGNNLAMSKKKLKWQEETQKLLKVPIFRGNFMNNFEDSHFAGSNAAQSEIPVEQVAGDDDESEGEDDDVEVPSPDEEEAQAEAEQEEVRRQAAEAQRAKMEEEELADIASDVLLGYIGEQNNGNKKCSSSLSTAVEDKRSDEEGTEEDDIDPQTIDKLIEISIKLHLPADDVVDIISDVEKKKKKDTPSEQDSPWRQPPTPLSHPFPSTNSFLGTQISTNRNRLPISKQPFNLLNTWFKGKSQTKLQDLWSNVAKPLLNNPSLWPKPKKPFSVKEFLFKSPKSSRLLNYQRKPYPDYHPIYFPPPPRAKSHFLIPKSAQVINNYLWNSVDGAYTFLPKRHFPTWAHPTRARLHSLRQAYTGLQQKSHGSYPLPLYSWTFQPVPVPRPHSPLLWRKPVKKQQKQVYYPSTPWLLMENEDYYVPEKQQSGKTDFYD